MAVTFTPNIGLAKPTESELALNWARATQLCEDNNLIIMDKTDINSVAYTPVLAGATTPPSVGAGSVAGQYQEAQGFVWGSFVIQFVDPGVAVGNGEYGITLPFVADGAFHTVGNALALGTGTHSCIGEGYALDDNSIPNCGTLALDVVTFGGVSYARFITETHAAKTSRVFRNAMPFSVATLDNISGSFFYKHT